MEAMEGRAEAESDALAAARGRDEIVRLIIGVMICMIFELFNGTVMMVVCL